MRYQAGNQSDTQFQHKGFRGSGNVDRVHDIRDGHSHGSCQSAVPAAQKQGPQYAEGVSDMKRRGVSSGQWNLYLQKGKRYVTQCRQKRGLCQFNYSCIFLVHRSFLLSVSDTDLIVPLN